MTNVAEPIEQTAGTAPTGAPTAAPLADLVRGALDGTGHGWLRCVRVAHDGGCIVLSGSVPSFYLKQMAQTVVLAVPGVVALRNDLRVEGGN
jgi:hypothetical protein